MQFAVISNYVYYVAYTDSLAIVTHTDILDDKLIICDIVKT